MSSVEVLGSVTPPWNSLTAQLEEIYKLRKEEALTQGELAAEKADILCKFWEQDHIGEVKDMDIEMRKRLAQWSCTAQLKEITLLRVNGYLTEGEFERAKGESLILFAKQCTLTKTRTEAILNLEKLIKEVHSLVTDGYITQLQGARAKIGLLKLYEGFKESTDAALAENNAFLLAKLRMEIAEKFFDVKDTVGSGASLKYYWPPADTSTSMTEKKEEKKSFWSRKKEEEEEKPVDPDAPVGDEGEQAPEKGDISGGGFASFMAKLKK